MRARPTLEACKQTAASAGQVFGKGAWVLLRTALSWERGHRSFGRSRLYLLFYSQRTCRHLRHLSTLSAGEAKSWTSAASSFVDVAHLGHASSRSMTPATVAALRSAIQLWPLADGTFCKCFGKLLL